MSYVVKLTEREILYAMNIIRGSLTVKAKRGDVPKKDAEYLWKKFRKVYDEEKD